MKMRRIAAVRRMPLAAALLLIAQAWLAAAESPAKPTAPAKPPAAQQATAAPAPAKPAEPPVPEPPPPPPPPPKIELLLNEAATTGVVGDTVAKMKLSLAFEALASSPQEMLLLPPDVSVTAFTFAGRGGRYAQIVRGASGYLLRTTDDGAYALDIQYVARVEKKEKARSLTLPLVAAAKATTELTVPGASVELTLSPEVSYEAKAAGADTLLSIYGAAAPQVTVAWKPKLELKKVEPVLFADQNAQVTVGRGVLRVDTVFDYTILQGKVKELSVALPAGATLLSVKGEGLRSWDVAAQSPDRALKLQLVDEIGDRYRLELQLEQPIGKGKLGEAASFTVPAIAAQGVERETGAIGLLVWKGLKVEPTKTEGVTQVDVREMPAAFQALKDQVHLAYRYLQRPFEVEARVSEVEAKVAADVFTGVRVSPEALRFSSQISYTIKDAGIFRLRIRLGKDIKLVDLQGENINNWERDAEALTIDLRSKAEGPYDLTLETEQAIPQGQAQVELAPIELLDVARERGHLALSAYSGIKIEPVAPENIMQIDVSDLPEARRAGAELAFRYLKHPYKLAIAISKVEAEVAAAVHTTMEVNEKRVDITSALQYDIRKAGIFQLQVALPKGFRLLGCDGQAIDDWKVADPSPAPGAPTLAVSLKQRTQGSYTLRLTGKQDVESLADLPMPVFKALGAEKETGFIAVRADESLRLKTGKTEALAEIDVKELPSELQKGQVLLAYKYFAQPWSGVLAAEPIEPHVTAETFTFLSLGEALLQASVTIRYSILYAGVQTFRLQLPDAASNVDFKGEDIKHREEDKQNHVWTISLQAKKKTRYDLFLTYEEKVAGEAIDLKHSGVQVLDIKRETGYLAMAARSDLELTSGSDLEGLTPIDPQEIPADFKTGIYAPLLLAFRYLKHPYTLHATAVKHDPADVLVAVIEACLLSTTLTEDGNLITDMACRLRNTREQNLAIALPKDAELWHVFVDGRRAIPVRSQEGEVLWTKVPIAGVGDGDRSFIVQLRYGRKTEPLAGNGILTLDFPRMAIPAMRLGWQLALPEKYHLVRHTGSLRHVDYLDSELAALARFAMPTETAEQVPLSAPSAADANYNRQAQDNLQQTAGAVVKGRARGQRSIYTGAKPETPNVYNFQSLIAMKQPGDIRSVYLRSSVDEVIQGALVVATAAVVLAFWTLCRRWSRLWRLAVVLSLALVVLGGRTLAEEAYHQHMTDVLWALILTSLAMLVWDGAKAIGARGDARRQANAAPDRSPDPLPAPGSPGAPPGPAPEPPAK